MISTHTPPIVIDLGTHLTMTGFAGDNLPKVVFPTVVGYKGVGDAVDSNNSYVGQSAFDARCQQLVYPLKAGRIIDWEAVRYIISSVFDELQTPSSESNVLVSIPFINHRENKEQLAEFLFNTLRVGNLSIFPRQPLAFLATRRRTGVVIDVEPSHAAVVPVYENFSIQHATEFVDLTDAGSEIAAVVEHILSAIDKTDTDIHEELYDNIVLTGSYTTMSGFEEILKDELQKLAASETRISLVAVPERLYLTWIGGSILANAGTSQVKTH